MKELKGACIFGQSGGPTSVINASAYGVFDAALKNPNITRVLGAEHGIVGVLNDRLFDMSQDAYLADELLKLADWGATLCDVIGDLYGKHPDELCDDPQAVKKQMALVDKLHEKGVEVLMSSHLYRFAPVVIVVPVDCRVLRQHEQQRGQCIPTGHPRADGVGMICRQHMVEGFDRLLHIGRLKDRGQREPVVFRRLSDRTWNSFYAASAGNTPRGISIAHNCYDSM